MALVQLRLETGEELFNEQVVFEQTAPAAPVQLAQLALVQQRRR
jgi:hypothetical protein